MWAVPGGPVCQVPPAGVGGAVPPARHVGLIGWYVTFLKNSGESCYVSQASYPPQFARFTAFAFGRGLRLAVLMMVLGMSGRMVGAADLLYVAFSIPTGQSASQIITYDVSLSNAVAVANSASIFVSSSTKSLFGGIAFDQTGNLYVGSYSLSTVSKFSSSGIYQTSITTNLNSPEGLVCDGSGNLYVANRGNHTISKFDSSGAFISSISGNLNEPLGLAVDASNNLYAANPFLNSISKFNSNGNFVSSISSNINTPVIPVFDSSGNLYVTNFYNNTISKFNSSGTFISTISGHMSYPQGLAFDTAGNLYVTNAGNSSISKFNAAGIFQFSWNTNTSSNPTYLAIRNSVPEPSTYALGLIAAGAMAWVGRRRKGCRNQA